MAINRVNRVIVRLVARLYPRNSLINFDVMYFNYITYRVMPQATDTVPLNCVQL